jgi:glycosyltransferase involved in cell wall biosynthesis
MISVANGPPARLFTTFGTVLYVDPSGALRHGPIEDSPANAVFVGIGGPSGPHRSGSIVHLTSESQEPVVCTAEWCRAMSAVQEQSRSPGAITLELIALERGLIALKASGRFLCAEASGRVSLSRATCSTWECFLASEAWCSASDQDALPPISAGQIQFDVLNIKKFILSPLVRVEMNGAASSKKKILVYGYTAWSRGRIYYDLCKQLHRKGYTIDILSRELDHSDYMDRVVDYYDLLLTAVDGVPSLIDNYGVLPEKMIVVSHHETDVRSLTELKGLEIFDKFAAYGAVSDFVCGASMMQGVQRPPRLVPLGVDWAEFYAEAPARLKTVGYASSMSAKTFDVERKRGHLAQDAARAADLPFKVAGSTEAQVLFHQMPAFYRSVDAVLVSSLSEAEPLPVMEAAAAGRLVIGTPVGDFPLKASQGGGIIAPIEPEKFVEFTASTLKHYKDHPADFVFKCLSIQEAARRFDWKYFIDDWADFIDSA